MEEIKQEHEHAFVIGELDNVQTSTGGRTGFTAKVCGCGLVEVHPVQNWALLTPDTQELIRKRLVASVVKLDEDTAIVPKPSL